MLWATQPWLLIKSKGDDSKIPVQEGGEKCESKQQQKQTIIFCGW